MVVVSLPNFKAASLVFPEHHDILHRADSAENEILFGLIDCISSVTLATVVGLLLAPYLAHRNICMLYLLAVVYVASKRDWFLSILSVLLSLASYEYFISPPQFSFFPLDVEAFITFSVVMVVSVVMSRRTMHINRLAGNLETQVAERTKELQGVNQQLSTEIEERLRTEQIQQQTLIELAFRNATLEHFAKLTVHDLREPLRTMIGYVNLLEKRFRGNLECGGIELIEPIGRAVERMERLIDGIGALARLDSSTGVFQCVNAGDVVNEAMLNLSEETVGKEASVIVCEDVCRQVIFCNYSQMVHVFQNLISNALKFCRDCPRIYIDCVEHDGEVVFSVADNGIGIEDKYKNKLFKLFQRLHSRHDYPGTGLGLVLCKRIVQTHGGQIWFESDPQIGTTFFFSLPIVSSGGKLDDRTAANIAG